ncbi:MAG: M23 family metallopeptidase [Halobacteriovoraceae bacterium]|nr:M23 family metallopeptidase [Halobacteriovoraceae bacterium]
MNYFNVLLLSFTFFSCSLAPRGIVGKVPAVDISIHPGEVRKVDLPLPAKKKESVLYCDGKKIITHDMKDHIMGIIAESYFSRKKSYDCFYGSGKKFVKKKRNMVARVKVIRKKYPSEILKVAKKMVVLSPKDLKRAIKEKKLLEKVYAGATREPLFNDGFVKPLKSKITSIYGTRRIYNNKKKSHHLGIDFRAKIGRPVPVANDGKVVLARNLFFTGYTVIVDHGLGVFTMYGHLSKLKTREGKYVKRKELIGLAGNTGRVTGPHLHWGVKVHGSWINGFSLIRETR